MFSSFVTLFFMHALNEFPMLHGLFYFSLVLVADRYDMVMGVGYVSDTHT